MSHSLCLTYGAINNYEILPPCLYSLGTRATLTPWLSTSRGGFTGTLPIIIPTVWETGDPADDATA